MPCWSLIEAAFRTWGALVSQLQASGRSEHSLHTEVFRPWGSYEGVWAWRALSGQAHQGEARRQHFVAVAPASSGALGGGEGAKRW